MKNFEKKFTKIILKILKIKKKPTNFKIKEISNWDSLNNLQLLFLLEKEFQIKFTENDLSNFTSLNKIFNILKKKLNAKN